MTEGERPPERVCACGCGRSLVGRRPQARYHDGACRARHARAEGRGCFAPAYTPKSAPKRHKAAKRRSPRPGVTVYFRDPADLAVAVHRIEREGTVPWPVLDAMQTALARHRKKRA